MGIVTQQMEHELFMIIQYGLLTDIEVEKVKVLGEDFIVVDPRQ